MTPSRAKRALTGLLSTTILAGALVAAGTGQASAAEAASTYNVVDRDAAKGVTADALPTVQIDGVVWDQAIVGDTVYAGGQFANARPAGAAAGTNLTPRGNLLSYNIRTGVLNPGFAPTVNGRIRAMAVSPDKSRLYVVGSFTTVNGQSRSRVAAFNTSDGSLVSTFKPVASSDVFSIAVSNDAVYLGGWFGAVNGVARQRLAAVSPSTGATLAWAPTADSTVNTMTLTPDGSRLVVGGIFAALNGSAAIGLGSLDATTGTLYPFAANQTIKNYGNSAGIYSLKSDGTNIYGAAYWYGGTGNFEGMFVADPMSGALKSMADCHGDTYDVSPVGGVVYTVSHHHDCSNMNGFPDTNPRSRWMRANAFTVDATTTTGPNNAGGYYSFQGQPSSSIVNWFPDVSVGSFTGQSQGGWTTEATSEYVVQGGEFPLVNNVGQQGLVRFAIPSIATNKQGPRATAADSAPSLRGISGSSVRVSFKANFDRDDQQLTYKLFRTDRPATPVLTRTVTSQFWNRPIQVFTDTGLTPGASYGYYVTATDPSGNTAKSATTSITTGTTVVDDSPYSRAVQTDGATHYWRLDEAAGETTSVDWAGGNDLVLGSGVTNGAAGAVTGSPDTAATFDGTAAGVAGQTSTERSTNTFSAEAWFKTTTATGGKILGFGDSQTGNSGSYDRHVYMDNSGRLTFGVYPGGVRALTSQASYNNGQWHHVVASLSPAGQQLYVDGIRVGTDGGTTSGQDFQGYWRVGGDNIGGWPNQPSSSSFAGTVDDVAIYPTALSQTQIRDHYTKSGRTVDVPPAPTDRYGQQVYGDSPLFFWRLDETSGSTVADATEARTAGNVAAGVTLGGPSPVTAGKAAAFDGSTGTIATARTFTNPTAYSEEVWFSTTTTNGGKLMGFGDQQSGYSGNYDRHIYLENSGQLTFGVWTGQANTTTTPATYNDGRWHHMVATQDPTAGMRLYVDGVLVGTNGQTSNQGYTGYWRIGGDTSWGGNSSFLAGSLDEAAVYPYALSATQVAAHYNASDAAVNAAPVAALTSSCTDATCFLDGSGSSDADGSVAAWAWDFGDDTTATGSTATHTYAASGTYTVSLTVTDDKGAKATTTRQVMVTKPVPNQAPVAAFTSTCAERACSFDAGTSADADGTVATYAWTFGDGDTSALAAPTHTYAVDGTYQVTLTVTDDRGGSDTVTHPVSVQKANTAPVAAFTSTTTDLVAAFDASASADADGTVAGYAWTFGDGTTGTGATPRHTYPRAGSFDVTLTVTDNRGGTNQVTQAVTVTAAPPAANVKPVAAFASSAADLKV
ncbi:PKD domain-containing protein, partial [Microlunatus capsulatus]